MCWNEHRENKQFKVFIKCRGRGFCKNWSLCWKHLWRGFHEAKDKVDKLKERLEVMENRNRSTERGKRRGLRGNAHRKKWKAWTAIDTVVNLMFRFITFVRHILTQSPSKGGAIIHGRAFQDGRMGYLRRKFSKILPNLRHVHRKGKRSTITRPPVNDKSQTGN
eukprot:GHVN01043169.1.p1 GENE.GHVN01043169.1~~GHVN01043169.1.p1  ORF type:complete len:164 (-),score=14.21 GHVN01043169.1:13-504(-)